MIYPSTKQAIFFMMTKRTSGFKMRLERPEAFAGLQLEPHQTYTVLPFHNNQLACSGGVLRGACAVSSRGQVVLNIRTRDMTSDLDALAEIARQLDVAGPNSGFSGPRSGIKVRVHHQINERNWYYVVTAAGVPTDQMPAAMLLVDKVAKKIFEKKEEPYFRDRDAALFKSEVSHLAQ
jgi:hypothetical protein